MLTRPFPSTRGHVGRALTQSRPPRPGCVLGRGLTQHRGGGGGEHAPVERPLGSCATVHCCRQQLYCEPENTRMHIAYSVVGPTTAALIR